MYPPGLSWTERFHLALKASEIVLDKAAADSRKGGLNKKDAVVICLFPLVKTMWNLPDPCAIPAHGIGAPV
jgi:hypothetical protein